MNKHYKPVIGLEIHAQLNTKSKMFCCCEKESNPDSANANICPVCLGHPGMLPVPNKQAIEWTIQTGLATNCTIRHTSKFDRKHYFYPDLPKGYQISQYDEPLCEDGHLTVDGTDIPIARIHLEEDTGKLAHGAGGSAVDYNRAGAPLMELVTAATIQSSEEAVAFCKAYQKVLRSLGVSEANMELGEMRCEANVSLQEEGSFEYTRTGITAVGDKALNNKVEVKNLNSFKIVGKAIEHELIRQAEALERGEEIQQETRGWDESKEATVSQRTKESAKDYRYFPEPDIPPLTFTKEEIEELRNRIPELNDEKVQRFVTEYRIPESAATILAADKDIAIFFENVMSEAGEWVQALKEKSEEVTKKETEHIANLTANWITSELLGMLKETDTEIQNMFVTAENFAELMIMLKENKINSSAGQTILRLMLETKADPSDLAERRNLLQESDESAIEQIVEQVIAEHAEAAEDYRGGNERSLKFLMGQVMKQSQGKANPQMATELLKKKLG